MSAVGQITYFEWRRSGDEVWVTTHFKNVGDASDKFFVNMFDEYMSVIDEEPDIGGIWVDPGQEAAIETTTEWTWFDVPPDMPYTVNIILYRFCGNLFEWLSRCKCGTTKTITIPYCLEGDTCSGIIQVPLEPDMPEPERDPTCEGDKLEYPCPSSSGKKLVFTSIKQGSDCIWKVSEQCPEYVKETREGVFSFLGGMPDYLVLLGLGALGIFLLYGIKKKKEK